MEYTLLLLYQNNHKITKIEWLDDLVDVCDLELKIPIILLAMVLFFKFSDSPNSKLSIQNW